MPRKALIAAAALALYELSATAARAPTTTAAPAPDPTKMLPPRFIGLWRVATEGSASCPAQAPEATNVTDESLMLVRPSLIAFMESGCRVDGVRTAVSRTHPDRVEPTTVMLTCEGEGIVDQHTEVWSTDRRGDDDALTTLDVGRRVTTSYLRCEGAPTRSTNARQATGPDVPHPSAELSNPLQGSRVAGAPGQPGESAPDPARSADARAAEAGAASRPIATCNEPWVLAFLRDTTFTPDVKLKLALQGVPTDDVKIGGIVQQDYDAANEHRLCRAALSISLPVGSSNRPTVLYSLRYRIDRRLDGDRGSWVTCDNCR